MKARAVSSLPVVYKAAEERLLCRKGGTSQSPGKDHTKATNQVGTGEDGTGSFSILQHGEWTPEEQIKCDALLHMYVRCCDMKHDAKIWNMIHSIVKNQADKQLEP